MAVHIPPCARVLQKAVLGRKGQLAPEALSVRPKSVDDAAPVSAVLGMRGNEIAKPAEQPAELRAERHIRRAGLTRRCAFGSKPRREIAMIGPLYASMCNEST